MTEIINARFQEGGKEYSFNPNGLTVAPGDAVIVSTTAGPEYGVCTEGNHMVDETTLVAPLRQVLRLATEEDEAEHARKQETRREREKSGRRPRRGLPRPRPRSKRLRRRRPCRSASRKSTSTGWICAWSPPIFPLTGRCSFALPRKTGWTFGPW